MAANATAILILKLRDLVSGPSKGVKQAFTSIGKSLAGVKKTFDTAGHIGFAATAVNQLGQQSRAALTSVLEPAIRFEDTIARVGALTNDISPANMKKLTDAAREMGRTTRFTAQEAAEGLAQLAIAGYKTEDQIKALPPVLKLTQASGSEMGRVADIVSDLMGGFGKKAKDTGEIAGVLAATFSNSTTTLETLYETMKYAAPVATDLGISMQQTAVLTGLLGNAGVKGSMAGTSLRQMMLSLTKPSKAAQGALSRLGISGQEVAKNLDKPATLLQKIFKAFDVKGATRGERLKALNQIFGQRAVTSASVLLKAASTVDENGVTAFERLAGAVGEAENRLDKMASIMDSTQLASIRRLASATESLKIDIAEKLAPTFAPLVEDVTAFVGRLARWAKENPALVATMGKVLIGITGITAVLGPLLLTLSSLVSLWGVFRGVMLFTTAPINLVIRALRGLNKVTDKAIDGLVNITGASKRMSTSLKLIKGAVGVVSAAFAGWEVGKYLDEAIGKALNLRGQLLSTEIGLKAAESNIVSDYLQAFGEFYEIDSLTEAAKKNKQINRERQQTGIEASRNAVRESIFKYMLETPTIRWTEDDKKVKVEIDVKGEARVKKVKAGKAVEASVGSNTSPL